jgi:DNA polymerase
MRILAGGWPGNRQGGRILIMEELTVADVLTRLRAFGVYPLRREGERLIMFVPKKPEPDPSFRPIVREHKAALLAYLDSSRPVFLDVETRSHASLRDMGGRRYAADPSTQILSAVFSLDGTIISWTPGRFPPTIAWPTEYGPTRPIITESGNALPRLIADAIASGRPICSHNALGFERWIWRAKRLPEPLRWIDTIPWARSAGCPASLDGAASWLLGKTKDTAGEALIKRYCLPYGKDKKFREIDGADWQALIRYNLIDVLLLEQIYAELRHYDQEPELLHADQVINERGVCVDVQLAKRILELAEQETARLAAEAERLTAGAIKATDLNRTVLLVHGGRIL